MEHVITALVILAVLAGCIALAGVFLKRTAIAEDDLQEEKETSKQLADLVKEAKDNETLRDKTYRDSLAGKRPDSVRKYDR